MNKLGLISLLMMVQLLVVPSVSADGGGDNRVVFGASVMVDREDSVKDLVVFGGSARVLGRVNGDLVVFGGGAGVSGEVLGNVVVLGGSAELESTARVGGDVVTFGGSLRKEPGATVGGSLVRGAEIGSLALPAVPSLGFSLSSSPFWGFIAGTIKGVFATVALLALAVMVVALVPRQLEVSEDVLENAFWQSAGLGILALMAIALLTPVLIISLVGIPLALLLWLVLLALGLYALVISANLIGERLMRSVKIGFAGPMVSVLAGLLLAMAVAVPFNVISGGCLGTLLLLLLVVPGIGATVLSRFGTLRWRPGGSGVSPSGEMFPPPSGLSPSGGLRGPGR